MRERILFLIVGGGIKMNIFKEMALSVYSFKSYKEFLNNKKLKVFGFGVVVMLIYWIITVGVPFGRYGLIGSGLSQKMEEWIPEFELEDGYLWVDKTVEYEAAGMYVNIDTDPESYFYDASEMRDFLNGYSQVILMDAEKIIIKNNGQIQQYYFTDFGNDARLSKADIIALAPTITVWIVIGLVITYLWMTALFFFGVLFVALLGMIVASCMKCQLSFGQLYLLGVYSRVLPLLIKAAVSLLPVYIPFFWVINFGLSVLILVFAVQGIKQDMVKVIPSGMGGSGYGSNYGNSYGNSVNQPGFGNPGNGGGNFTGNYGGNEYNGSNYNNSSNYNGGSEKEKK